MKIEISIEERDELVKLVENYFEETRVEVRHTQNREFRSQLQHEEATLRGLKDKLVQITDTEYPNTAVA